MNMKRDSKSVLFFHFRRFLLPFLRGFAFAAITGATTNSYTLSTLGYMTGYRFRCRIIGPLGSSTLAENSPLDSNAAVLTVTGSGGGGSTANRFDSTQSTLDSTAQTFDGT